MGMVVNLLGEHLKSPAELAQELLEFCEDGKIKSFVVVIETADERSDVWYTHQTRADIVFASKILDIFGSDHAVRTLVGFEEEED